MGREKRTTKADRDGGRFIALPHVVVESPGYRQLSHTARSLLIDVARQYDRRNNGRLTGSASYLEPMGWTSADVVTWALRELVAAGLLVETRKGGINRPSWFALTWYPLDQRTDLDIKPTLFKRGAYSAPDAPPRRPSHRRRGTTPTPPGGAAVAPIAPPGGVGQAPVAPPGGAIKADLVGRSAPPGGAYLEKPSAPAEPVALR